MKIRFITSVAAASGTYSAGEVVSLDLEVAQDFIAADYAVLVDEKPHEKAEKAINQKAEKAEKR